MLRRVLVGCPCTPLSPWSRLAQCRSCGKIFDIKHLVRCVDGTLLRVPCPVFDTYENNAAPLHMCRLAQQVRDEAA